jgi:hypothetical protein
MLKVTLALSLLLALSAPAAAQQRPLPPPAARELDWKPGAPFADHFIADGVTVRIVRDGGVTVAVAGYDRGDYLVAEIAVANDTDGRFDVLPGDFFMTYWQSPKDKLRHMYSLPPGKVANKYRGRARWGNFFRSLAAGMAANRTTTSTETGTMNINGDGRSATGTYTGTTTTTARDDAALRRAAEANRRADDEAAGKADEVMSEALFANTLFPKDRTSGMVFFERKKFEGGILYVTVNGTAYTFAFAGTVK